MSLMPVRLPPPMREQVEREADTDGIGNSEVVRRALRYYFERAATGRANTSQTEEP